ncbi:avidin-like [Pleurodeles waltl]|uniref:avidin-like n=1 Tax=Pleurodeles waltl TaxID=8319 RepID=UPI0037095199
MAPRYGTRTPFQLLLGLVLTTTVCSKCHLSGMWKNDLGSTMSIGSVNSRGGFKGSYLTAVSSTNNTITESLLAGAQELDDEPIVGFIVKWNFSKSVTVFTGQCFKDDNGSDVLETMWLLRSYTEKRKDNWKATRVGTNVFTRVL